MKDGAFENAVLLQAVFNDKAFRSLDILKVDAAESGGHKLHQIDDFGRVFGIYADGKGIHIAKGLEQQGFAFHNRHGGGGADIAQAQNGCAVGYHTDKVGVVGIDIECFGLAVNFHARLGHAGRVGQGEVVGIAHGRFHAHLDFALILLMHGQGFIPQIFDTRHCTLLD